MRQYYIRVRNGQDTNEWMIGGVDLFNDPENDPAVSGYYTRDGYWVTTELEVAERWARQYGMYPPETRGVQLEVEDYIKQQEELAKLHAAWRKSIDKLVYDAAFAAATAAAAA